MELSISCINVGTAVRLQDGSALALIIFANLATTFGRMLSLTRAKDSKNAHSMASMLQTVRSSLLDAKNAKRKN